MTMCDYQLISRSACNQMPKKRSQLLRHLGLTPSRVLIQAARDGRARPGRCLFSGKLLPPTELNRSHYILPANWEQYLAQLTANPTRCGWCGGGLPLQQVQQQNAHFPAEALEHHFHEEPGNRCFSARLVAISVIFRDSPPSLLKH